MGFIHFVAFLSLTLQLKGLIGKNGLLPAHLYVDRVVEYFGGPWKALLHWPTLFLWNCEDSTLMALSYLGILFSLVVIMGFGSGPILLAIWILYLSFYHVGQLFYGYGWEILLLEGTFLAIFIRPFSLRQVRSPPKILIWFFRWVVFRVMFGAGMIKLRSSDACWTNLTCLHFHFETQPLPNPLSWLLHQSPSWILKMGVLGNHFVELLVPFFLFMGRRWRIWGGILTIAFQILLILSGNLSWLNYLTIALCISCFDDRALGKISGPRTVPPPVPLGLFPRYLYRGLCILIIYCSIDPIWNLFSRHQIMNTSFNPFHLVNTYGAFGTIGRERREIILEGTEELRISEKTQWKELEFPCAPGNIYRRPCIVAPFQLRLDWQIWFAAMSNFQEEPWLSQLMLKILQGEKEVMNLLEKGPFTERPPRHIRALLYQYQFTQWGESQGAWWKRKYLGLYAGPFSLNHKNL